MHNESTRKNTEITPENGSSSHSPWEIACQHCDFIFTRRYPEQRFCSRSCYQQWWTANRQPQLAAKGTRRLMEMVAEGGADAERIRARIAAKNRRMRRQQQLDALSPAPVRPAVDVQTPVMSGEVQGKAWKDAGARWEQHSEQPAGQGRELTLVIAGFGSRLNVRNGALVVQEGITHYPQNPKSHVLYRGVHGVDQIVLLTQSGSLTFDAMAWCREQGVALTVLNRDGGLVSVISPDDRHDAKLRRAQYLAATNGKDVKIAQWLLQLKLRGQLETLERLRVLPRSEVAKPMVAQALSELDRPWRGSIQDLQLLEGRAAQAYFDAWIGLPLRWKKAAAKRIPPHWLTIRERSSPLSGNGRRAVDPFNAILNYAYALLEGQCRHVLNVLGFDPACGFLHADKINRDSLVYDLMEPFRTQVDGMVLKLVSERVFADGDFVQDRTGQCRLHPELGKMVVSTCRLSSMNIGEVGRQLRANFGV